MLRDKRIGGTPSLLVSVAALIVAVGGAAFAAGGGLAGADGSIHACVAQKNLATAVSDPTLAGVTQVVTPAGTMLVFKPGTGCPADTTELDFNQTGPAGPTGPAELHGAESHTSVTLTTRSRHIVTAALPAGDYALEGRVDVAATGTLTDSVLVQCRLVGADGRNIGHSTSQGTLPAGQPRPAVTIPLVASAALTEAGDVSVECRGSGHLATAHAAGLIDGSVNSIHVLDHANMLGVLVNSKISDESNNNANTRANGKNNNAINY